MERHGIKVRNNTPALQSCFVVLITGAVRPTGFVLPPGWRVESINSGPPGRWVVRFVTETRPAHPGEVLSFSWQGGRPDRPPLWCGRIPAEVVEILGEAAEVAEPAG
jgi:hypothetical protein